MHRSSSTARTSDEFLINIVPSSNKISTGIKASSVEIDQIPMLDPVPDVGKKESSRNRSSENLVHVIPLVLILCAIALWIFSHPVDLANEGDPIVARVEGITVEEVKDSRVDTQEIQSVNQTGLQSPLRNNNVLEPPQTIKEESANLND